MKTITVKEYADQVGISVQAAHKRVKKIESGKKKYAEIKKVIRFSNNFVTLQMANI